MSTRVSSESYRAVASNHIYGFTYNEEDHNLFIQFYNGAVYKIMGVPKGLYEGMHTAPSAGCFFWDRIRNVPQEKERFPTINLGKKPLGYLAQVDNIQYEIYPDLAKLDQIDSQELKVEKNFSQGKINQEEYYRLMEALTIKREKVIKKLEKDGYSFDDPIQPDPEKSVQRNCLILLSLLKGLLEAMGIIGDMIKFVLVGMFQIVGAFFGLLTIMSKMGR